MPNMVLADFAKMAHDSLIKYVPELLVVQMVNEFPN